jgi:monoamine oxidase
LRIIDHLGVVHSKQETALEFDIAILGAGVAGLAAGRILAKSGLRVAVVEARHRVGGRIFTAHVTAGEAAREIPVELGAEFVHGLPPETWQIIREAGLDTYEREGALLCSNGGPVQVHDEHREGGIGVLERMKQWVAEHPGAPDMSFKEYLRLVPAEPAAAARAVEYVEGFNAADSALIGIKALAKQQQAEDEIDTDRLFYVRRGYDALPGFLAREIEDAGGTILLGRIAQRVLWQRGAVTMSGVHATGNPFTVSARRALISVPLGVLQAGSIEFAPSPAAALAQAQRLVMGPVMRMTLIFRSRFWAAAYGSQAPVPLRVGLERLSFLFTHGALPSTWWTPMPDTAAMITAWVAGPRVALIEAASKTTGNADAFLELSLTTLANAFGLSIGSMRQLLLSWHTHDWQADRYALGAYSYAPAGAVDASDRMAEPVEDTLFFAGEHTDTSGHWGTVHGAVRSGMRAATQLQHATQGLS